LMAPLRSRNVNPSSVGSERCRIHMAAYLTEIGSVVPAVDAFRG
jgi:hypothetical protein